MVPLFYFCLFIYTRPPFLKIFEITYWKYLQNGKTGKKMELGKSEVDSNFMINRIKQSVYTGRPHRGISVVIIDMRVDIIVGDFWASWWPMWYSSHSYKMENRLTIFLPKKVKHLTQDLILNRLENIVDVIFKKITTSIASAFSRSQGFKAQMKFTKDHPSEPRKTFWFEHSLWWSALSLVLGFTIPGRWERGTISALILSST